MSLPLVMAAEASKPRRTSPSKTSPSTSPLQVTTWAKSRLVLETLEEVKCLTSEDSGVVLEALALPTTALVKEASEVSRWEALEVVCLTSGISPKKTKPVSRRCARLSKRGCRTERALVASEASRWEASVHLTTAPAKVDLVASEAVCLTLEEEACPTLEDSEVALAVSETQVEKVKKMKMAAWASEASTSMSHPLKVLHRKGKSPSTAVP